MLSRLIIAAGVYCHKGQYGMMVAVLVMYVAIYM